MKSKAPKTLGQIADTIYKLREERYVLQNKAKDIESEEKRLKEKLRVQLLKFKSMTIGGKVAQVKMETATVPRIKDWDAFYAYVKKTGEFDLLQRRLNETAIEERWGQKKHVPGVQGEPVLKFSITKL